MSGRKLSLDTLAAQFVVLAKQVAKEKGITTVKAFGLVTEDIPRVTTGWRAPSLFEGFLVTKQCKVLKAEHDEGRLQTLRFDLDAALLRLDACCPLAGPPGEWPDKSQLKALTKLVDDTAHAIGKRTPVTCWKRCERVDHHFPKLRLCRRVSGFVNRIVESTPPRPTAVLTSEKTPLIEEFCNMAAASQRGNLALSAEDLERFEPLLLKCQNAALPAGKAPWTVLRLRPGVPPCPPAIEAYVAFLELEQQELLWTMRYSKKLLRVWFWAQALGNTALVKKLALLQGWDDDFIASIVGILNDVEVTCKRASDKDRKAKSRKKLG